MAAIFTLFVATVAFAGLIMFHVIDLKRLPVPAAVKVGNRLISLRGPAPSPQITPLPPVHNSAETECDKGRQCTDEEFADMLVGLRRQWTLTPEDVRSKCVAYSTYPTIEHCILTGTVTWFSKHPSEAAPWINPKNFDTAIMDMCRKDPKSLPLCLKP